MLTINDFALMDDTWKGTISCGHVGAEILNILKKGKGIFKGNFYFDVEWDAVDGKCVRPGKYIVEGFSHGSQQEQLLIQDIVKFFPIKKLPALWENNDFIAMDRDIAIKEIEELRNKHVGTGFVRGLEILYLNETFKDQILIKLEPPQSGTRLKPIQPGKYAIWSCNGDINHTLIDDNFTESFMYQIDKLRGR